MYEHHYLGLRLRPEVWPQNKCRSLTSISWSSDFALYLFDVLTSYFGFMGQHESMFDLKINVGPVILLYILKTIWCMNIILWDYGSVWPDVWHQNTHRSQWPIFHGPCILKTIWNMNFNTLNYALGHIGVFLTEFSRKAIISRYCNSSLAAVNQDNHLNIILGTYDPFQILQHLFVIRSDILEIRTEKSF